MKVFFEKFDTPFETLPFGCWEIADYLPAAKHAIEKAKERIEQLKKLPENTFHDFLLPYLESSRELDLISHTFFNLHSANTNDEMEQVARELSPLLAQFSNDLLLDGQLFQKIKALHETRKSQNLTIEELTILEEQYKHFVRNGALLGQEKKSELCQIDERLAKLGVEFGKNALQAKNQFVHPITEKDLQGIPEENWEVFQNAAKERGLSGHAVTFDFPVYIPFMKGSDNRELREKIYTQYVRTATSGEFDNRELCLEILRLKNQRAKLLGHPYHASYVLENRMAKSSQEVMDFIQDLRDKAWDKALDEIKQLAQFAGLADDDELRPWDFSYYSEKYRKQLLDFDDEILRPYFPLENVIQGVFDLATRLYQIKFRENTQIPKYHPDVKVYEVLDQESSQVCGILYGDFFPRPSKRQGAWMCHYRDQSHKQIPHVGIVCNFTKSTANKPSLLTHDEVRTLFHEFGHALHGLLSRCQYPMLSGTNVYWDFVELPSQMLENWAYEKECLDLFAKHYQTGEPIAPSLVRKIKQSQTYMAGYATMRQLSFATLDMVLHTTDPSELTGIIEIEENIMKEFDLFNYRVKNSSMCATFGHIFNGGYSAGYYSYKWAEVLDADAFELFREKGIFDSQTAKSFKDNVLSKGGSEHPMVLYQRFRGQKPSVNALLKRCGLY